jgi:general transcriptional corepressor TUP1
MRPSLPQIQTSDSLKRPVLRVDVSPTLDDSMNDSDTEIEVQRSYSPREKLQINEAYEFEHESVVCCVRYSNDGKYLATGCNRKAQIFSVESGEKVR